MEKILYYGINSKIFTIEDLLAGKKPEYPSSVHQYKRTERVEEKELNNLKEFE